LDNSLLLPGTTSAGLKTSALRAQLHLLSCQAYRHVVWPFSTYWNQSFVHVALIICTQIAVSRFTPHLCKYGADFVLLSQQCPSTALILEVKCHRKPISVLGAELHEWEMTVYPTSCIWSYNIVVGWKCVHYYCYYYVSCIIHCVHEKMAPPPKHV